MINQAQKRKAPDSSTFDDKVQPSKKPYEKLNEQFPAINRAVFQNEIFSYLNNKDLVSFSLACRQTQEWTATSRLSRLFDAVEHGNQEEAEHLLRYNLLNIREHLLTGRINGKTVFQVALCAGDVEMCEMIKPYFERLQNGQDLIQEQFVAIFPNGIEAHVKSQEEAAFDFTGVIEAILKAPADEVQKALNKQFDTALPSHKALDTFRSEFTKVSRNEQIFNPQHFLKALEQYDATFDRADSWDKQSLIWRQIVGFTQRFFSACWAQAAAQGIYYIVEKNEKLQRHFNFRSTPHVRAFRPLVDEAGVGFDFAVALWLEDAGIEEEVRAVMQFTSSKNIKLGEITSAAKASRYCSCVIF